jgi:hypothetical protein
MLKHLLFLDNQDKSKQPKRKAAMKGRHQKKKRFIIESGSEDSGSGKC